jgi:hypothetical protein
MYRQGDVLLVKISDAEETEVVSKLDLTKEVVDNNDGGRIVLAYGEVTGHAHAIRRAHPDMKLFETGSGIAERILRLPIPAALKHEEHDQINLPAGTYKVVRQREYFPDEIKFVAD